MFLFKIWQRFIKPYATGYLPEKDGHRIFYQEVGNPNGEPVIVFHGGPGGACPAFFASIFDLKRQRVILFDQRGCGKTISEDPLRKNTAQDTIEDASRLLMHLRILEKVVCAGGSWGSTLALLFTETYPRKVKKLVLNSIFLGRRKDTEYLSPLAPYFYPDALEIVKKEAQGEKPDKYYNKLLFSDNLADREKAIIYYKKLEKLTCGAALKVEFPKTKVTERQINSFRIFMHYQLHHFFLKDNQILNDIKAIQNIPTVIYQNRLDFCCPPNQAFDLHKAMPKAEFYLIPDKGHGSDMLYYAMHKAAKKASS